MPITTTTTITVTTTVVTVMVEPSKTLILVQQKALWYAGRELLHIIVMPMPVVDTLHPKW